MTSQRRIRVRRQRDIEQARGFILVVVLLLAPTPLLAQGSVADVGVTFVPNFYDGEFFVPAAGAWGTVGRGVTRLHFDHVVSSPDNRMSTVLTEWQVGRWGRQSILRAGARGLSWSAVRDALWAPAIAGDGSGGDNRPSISAGIPAPSAEAHPDHSSHVVRYRPFGRYLFVSGGTNWPWALTGPRCYV